MKNFYGLSDSQKGWLNGKGRVSNIAKEKSSILYKTKQAWDIFVPVLNSKVVDQEFKDKLFTVFEHKNFGDFLQALLSTNAKNPTFLEINKMTLAKLCLERGFEYYLTRFKINNLVHSKIQEFQSLLSMLAEIYNQELANTPQSDLKRLRKGLLRPPRIKRDEYYHGYCTYCFVYNLNRTKIKDEVIAGIEHEKYCSFVNEYAQSNENERKEVIEDFIHFYTPLKNKKTS